MKYRMPAYYDSFVCIGAECEDTCCRGWQIAVDEESYQKYRKVPGAFGERLRRKIDKKSRRFRLDGRNCSFLDENGLCEIYKELGQESLCETCRTYPRHMEDYGEVREYMLSLTCPEATRILLDADWKADWKETEADVHRSEKEKRQDPDPQLFSCIQTMRWTILRLMANKDMGVYDRFAMALSYAHDLQRHFDMIYDVSAKVEDIADEVWRRQCVERISKRYLDEGAAKRFEEKLNSFKEKKNECYIRRFAMMRLLTTLEPVIHLWEEKQGKICRSLYHRRTMEEYEALEQDFTEISVQYEKEWINLFLYFIHTYLPGACYDEDVYDKVKLAVFSVVIIREWCLFQYGKTGMMDRDTIVAAAYRYAREVENSDWNLEHLEQHFQDDRLFDLKAMLVVLAGTKS